MSAQNQAAADGLAFVFRFGRRDEAESHAAGLRGMGRTARVIRVGTPASPFADERAMWEVWAERRKPEGGQK